ncbi:MAG: LamG domain-containing protein, partial [Candidatus Omnitrophota bacterium]
TTTPGANSNAMVDELNIMYDITKGISEALPAEYTTNNWMNQNTVSHDGSGFAAQSGVVEAHSSSYMERNIELTDDAVMSFWWKIASDKSDVLRLELVDGTSVKTLASRNTADGTDWGECVNIDLKAGSYKLRWVYDRTLTDSNTPDNRAWVDDISMVRVAKKWVELDGVESGIEIPDSPTLDLTGSHFTIEAMINLQSYDSDFSTIIGKIGWNNADSSYAMHITDQGKLRAEFYNINGNNIMIDSTATVSLQSWHHVAATYDGSKLVIYIDGIKAGQDTNTTGYADVKQNGSNVQIGRWWQSDPNYFNGKIDNVRIWNVTKGESDIAALKNTKARGDEAGLVLNYSFDDYEEGSTVKDSSGKGNDGTLLNGVSVKRGNYGSVYNVKEDEAGRIYLISAADFDESGVVDAADEKVIRDALGSTRGVELNAKQTSKIDAGTSVFRFNEPSGYHIFGDDIVESYGINEDPYYLNYAVNAVNDGVYTIGLSARSFNAKAYPMPTFKNYKFKVYVDGIERGEFLISANRWVYQDGTLDVVLDAGQHDIKLVWANPEKDLSIDLGKFVMRDKKYLEAADLNKDEVIDTKDMEIFGQHRVKMNMSAKIELEGYAYYANINADGTLTLKDAADGLIVFTSSVEDGNLIAVTRNQVTKKYRYFNDEEAGVISLLKESKYDLNSDGLIDEKDDEFMKESIKGARLIKRGDSYTTSSGSSYYYEWTKYTDGSASNEGEQYEGYNPWVEYDLNVESDGMYWLGINGKNNTSYAVPSNWNEPWGTTALVSAQNGGNYTTNSDGSIRFYTDYDYEDPQLYLSTNNKWPDGNSVISEIDRTNGQNRYVEIRYKYTNRDVPPNRTISTAKIYWYNSSGTYTTMSINVAAAGNNINDGQYHTYVIDMWDLNQDKIVTEAEKSLWQTADNLSNFYFQPWSKTGGIIGDANIQYIAFKTAAVDSQGFADYSYLNNVKIAMTSAYSTDGWVRQNGVASAGQDTFAAQAKAVYEGATS